MTIRVSALVSVYNAERFLEGRLVDLASQSLWERGELEIVVINSGSKQDDESIVFEFWGHLEASARERLVYIKTMREPLYCAWNRGVRLARGQYLTNANADDRLAPDALERLCAALDDASSLVMGVYGDCYVTSTPNATWNGFYQLDYPSYYPLGFTNWDQATPEVMAERCVVGNCPLWRRDMHDKCGLFDESYLLAGDYEMWLRAMAYGYRFLKIAGPPIGLFYHDPGQLSRANRQQIVMETRRAQLRWVPFLRSGEVMDVSADNGTSC
ncbi:MAG: hypothetical protein KatS3mg038_1036 [Candidatus Kapaibacterium sp.]|nr:MAG: hypothetical protein KatS3mg038_1036 [Candidatus Kapabacteria bacterium]